MSGGKYHFPLAASPFRLTVLPAFSRTVLGPLDQGFIQGVHLGHNVRGPREPLYYMSRITASEPAMNLTTIAYKLNAVVLSVEDTWAADNLYWLG